MGAPRPAHPAPATVSPRAWLRRGVLCLGLLSSGVASAEEAAGPAVWPNPDEKQALVELAKQERLGRLGVGLAAGGWTAFAVSLRLDGAVGSPDEPGYEARLTTARVAGGSGLGLILAGGTILGLAPHRASGAARVLGAPGPRGPGVVAKVGMVGMWSGLGLLAGGLGLGLSTDYGQDTLLPALVLGGASLTLLGGGVAAGFGTAQLVMTDHQVRGRHALRLLPTGTGVVLAGSF